MTCSITIHASQLSSCWIWHSTFSWVQFLLNKLEFFVSCNIKLQVHLSFCAVFSYVLFYKNLIVLHHGDNNFLFFFDIWIKFTLSTITSTMKKWKHLTWSVLWNNFFMIKMSGLREKAKNLGKTCYIKFRILKCLKG